MSQHATEHKQNLLNEMPIDKKSSALLQSKETVGTAETLTTSPLAKRFMGINPDHKGYCTPMTKTTCTPRRKALAKRLKPGGDLYKGKKS
tara:strand:+ start:25 stop:294 length:270 start_codon:yes stop_codon:yes gene_type:complete